MGNKKILLLSALFISFLLVGCSSSSGGDDSVSSGSIVGTITDQSSDLGAIVPIKVLVIEENPTADSTDTTNLTIVKETSISSGSSYTINEIPDGEYYAIAYKDLNGNGEIDVSDSIGPLDSAGFYGMDAGDEAQQIVISGSEEVGIDFGIESQATPITIAGTVETAFSETAINGAAIEIYGTNDLKVAETTTDSAGLFSFTDQIIDGKYYLEAAEDSYLPTLSPYFEIVDGSLVWGTRDNILAEDDLFIAMLTTTEAEGIGYTENSSMVAGETAEVDLTSYDKIYGASVELTPSSGTIGYMDDNGVDYDLTETQSSGG
ncbi:MAG: carboxypeptidase-like regulatory domain-containing protein, partial [Halanaerobacter sp.]